MHKSAITQLNALRAGLVCVALAASQVRAAEPPVVLLEAAIESSTDAVVLTDSPNGALSMRNCADPCSMKNLYLSTGSKFFVGQTPVTLAEFNAFVRRSPAQFMMIFHEPGKPAVTRLKVFGKL